MKHCAAFTGYSANDLEMILDRLALEVSVFKGNPAGLLKVYKTVSDEVERLKGLDLILADVHARLSRATACKAERSTEVLPASA